MAYLTLVPAMGRDYKSKKEVQADWDANKDFLINDMSSDFDGKYINKQQAVKGNTYNIRYKKLQNVHPIKG
jgi:hypothetical protein